MEALRSSGATSAPPGDSKLAVFWEDAAFSPMEIAEAASGLCRVVWVIGWSSKKVVFPLRVLRRLGDVVDVSGQAEAEILATLTPLGLHGVIVFTDPPQSLAAAAARHLGLSFHDADTARQLSDKLRQRVALQAGGIPVPRFATFRPSTILDAITNVESDVAFPAVLKPQQGAGSRDTFLVNNRDELRAALETCSDEDFILEHYLEDRVDPASRLGAQMVSVETVFPGGVAHHLAITGRFPLAHPFRETGSFLPSDLSPDDAQAVLALASAAAGALAVRHGVLHTEIKMTPTGPRVIEVNGRIGGGIPGLLTRVGGPPLLVWAMRLALSRDIGPIAELPSSPVAYFRWILAPANARTLRDVRGLEEVRALPGVNGLHLNRQPGDRLDAREGGTFGHVVALNGRVADHEALGALLAAIDANLELTYT